MNTLSITTTNTTSRFKTQIRRATLALLTLSAALPMASNHAALAQDKMVPASKMAGTMSDKMGSKMMAGGLMGRFSQVTHATKGSATLSGTGSKRVVKLNNFETGMGPKLHVYLVSGTANSNAAIQKAVKSGQFVDLGALRSLKGNGTYAVPASNKLGKGASVVIWCDKFDVAFGAAPLA